MDVLVDPPPVSSLGPKPLRVLLHTGVGTGVGESETESLTIPLVYPSETVFHIKQRIALLKGATKDWMPAYQFVAVKDKDGDSESYKPADVKWPLALSTVPDPLSPAALGKPNPHLYADGERKVGNPVRMPSLLLHDVFSEEDDRILHVWTLRTIQTALETVEESNRAFC